MKRIAHDFKQVGDSVEGIFEYFMKVKTGLYMHLDGVDSPISVSTALKRTITNNRELFTVGAKVKIILRDYAAGQKGGQTKLFDVFVNDEKCIDLVGTIANASDLNTFFS